MNNCARWILLALSIGLCSCGTSAHKFTADQTLQVNVFDWQRLEVLGEQAGLFKHCGGAQGNPGLPFKVSYVTPDGGAVEREYEAVAGVEYRMVQFANESGHARVVVYRRTVADRRDEGRGLREIQP